MSTVDELFAYAAIACVLQKKEKRKRKLWTKQWLERRNNFTHIDLHQELQIYPKDWNNYLRMDEGTYLELLSIVSPYIKKEDTNMRKAITPNERLTATLRYLATGSTLEDLKFSTRISPQALGRVIPETCYAIYKVLRKYCRCPTSEEEWKRVAREFNNRWNFPNCIGAMDGKHVAITPPPGAGSYFFNYKNFHSQVLFGVANANYELLYFSFGTNGRVSDNGVFQSTDFYRALENGSLNVPKEATVAGRKMPFVLVADDAFPLRKDIMKPFSRKLSSPAHKIFNYRLSRARRMIESVFGIIVERFAVLQKPISLINLDSVCHIVMACCALHNFLRSKIPNQYTPLECLDDEDFETGNVTPGYRCNQFMDLERRQPYFPTQDAKLARELFLEYFNNEGKVPWQDKFCF